MSVWTNAAVAGYEESVSRLLSSLTEGNAMADERKREMDVQDSDLGLGTVAPSQIRRRILERNGDFNVVRRGLSFWSSASIYHHLLRMTWSTFLGWAALAYLVLNLFFAAIYVALDVHAGALMGGDSVQGIHRFLRAFYFSVETASTIGYGNIIPRGDFANMVMTVESFIGLLSVALVTGLVFARFSRPTANVLFSEHALIAPYGDGGRAFMFRIVNGRRSQLIELQVQVILSILDDSCEAHTRRFHLAPARARTSPVFLAELDNRSPDRPPKPALRNRCRSVGPTSGGNHDPHHRDGRDVFADRARAVVVPRRRDRPGCPVRTDVPAVRRRSHRDRHPPTRRPRAGRPALIAFKIPLDIPRAAMYSSAR